RVAHDRRGLAELDRQRLDDLDLALREAHEHRRQLVERARPGLHPHALAALARVIQLQLVFLGNGLFGQSRGSGGGRDRGAGLAGGVLALEEIERHGWNPERGDRWRYGSSAPVRPGTPAAAPTGVRPSTAPPPV